MASDLTSPALTNHEGILLTFGDGAIKMSPGRTAGLVSLCLEPGDWGAVAGERRDGPPSEYWTKPGDVVLQFKNRAGLDALIDELTALREATP